MTNVHRLPTQITPTAQPSQDILGYRLRGRVVFGFIAGVSLLAGIGGWAATAQLSGAIVASGTVVVDENLKSVQHRDGGIVAGILVREGDVVEVGQILIQLDDATTRAELSIVSTQILELMARRARLVAERDALDRIDFPAALLEGEIALSPVIEGERRLFAGNLQHRESRKQQLLLSITQIEDEVGGLIAQLDSKREEIALVRIEKDRVERLVQQNLIESARIYATNRELARMLGEEGEITAAIARARSRISEINLQILVIDDAARTDAQRELSQVETRLSELGERRSAVEDRLLRTDIRAPSTGVVNELGIHTVGGVITPAEILVTIVPLDARLRIEAQIPPSSIDQVRPGQDARLRFSAFNHRTTPEIPGTVVQVSAAPTRDVSSGLPYYLATVEISEGSANMMDGLSLLPGMPVEVFITTEHRTALEYLVAPVTDQFERAFRER